MIFKIVLIVLLIFVFISLGTALYHLVNNKGNSDKLIKSLSWRIGLSAGIFILLLIGQALGLIQPHGL
ncbi:MAG: twin transmembrane helix small protein [Gammaproteobacteria bacterium]|nr:twin transmembrane helix small protein [Gammaproteobacteria bacterium]